MENLEPFNPPDFTDRIPKVGEEDYITAELENRIKRLLLTNDAYLKGKLEELSEKSGIDLQTLTEKDSELKELFDNINRTLSTHTQDSNTHVSLTEKQNWNQAEANQNAFSSVNAGGTVIQSNGKTAQFSILAGTDNVTISGDNAKKQVKISVSKDADTLGGKDASAFMQAKEIPSGISKLVDIKEEGFYTIYEGSTRYSDYPTFFKNLGFNYGLLEVIKNSIYIIQKLFVVPADGSSVHYAICYNNKDNNGTSGWKQITDGNAKTLDGIDSSGFFRRYRHPTGTDANTIAITGIHTCIGWKNIPREATSVDGQGTLIVINYNGFGGTLGVDNIWLKQQFISPHGMGTWTRYAFTTFVGEWVKDVTETMVSSLAHTNFYTYTPETNLNTLLAPGCYQLGSSIHAKLSLNFPLEGVGGSLRVEGNGNVRTQTFYAFAGKSNFVRVFYRHYFKNAETGEVYWSEWDEKISSQNVSNPNLLDNPDFRINQKGQNFYTASGQYTVDRWLHNTVDGFKVYFTTNGIRLDASAVSSSGTAKATLIQYIENYKKLLGKMVTISFKFDYNSEVHTKEVVIPTSEGSTKALSCVNSNRSFDIFLYYNGTDKLAFNIRMNSGKETFEWVKLELGSCPTPFVPPNPALELIKCQRHFEKVYTPICRCVFINGDVFGGAEFKVEKRIAPTVTVTANVVGETTKLPIEEIGYPSQSGFTYAKTSRQLSLDCPIYYYYEADANIY